MLNEIIIISRRYKKFVLQINMKSSSEVREREEEKEKDREDEKRKKINK